MGKWLSIAPSWMETIDKISKQGYVWIKTETYNGYWVHKEELANSLYPEVLMYPNIRIRQADYGKTFALTKEELAWEDLK